MRLFEVATEQYKTDLDLEKTKDLMRRFCKDAVLKNPIVRGMGKFSGGFGIIHGGAGNRRSANTTNHYTTLLDAVLPTGYPKRSKSIICSTYEGRDYAEDFGNLYAIIPYDGVKIGVCSAHDMWSVNVNLPEPVEEQEFDLLRAGRITMEEVAAVLNRANINEDSAADIKAYLRKLFGITNEEIAKRFLEPFQLATTATSNIYNDGKKHELWISGKCIAVDFGIYCTLNAKRELEK